MSLRLDQAIGTVTAKDGKTATHTTEHATGMIDNPMSDDQIVAKFLDNAAPAVGEETAAEIKEMVWELEKADNLVKLMKSLG